MRLVYLLILRRRSFSLLSFLCFRRRMHPLDRQPMLRRDRIGEIARQSAEKRRRSRQKRFQRIHIVDVLLRRIDGLLSNLGIITRRNYDSSELFRTDAAAADVLL